MTSQQREEEKETWQLIKPLLKVPPTNTQKGINEYQQQRRRVKNALKDPEFRQQVKRTYKGLTDFLRNYDLNPKDLDDFLNMDMREFLKKDR